MSEQKRQSLDFDLNDFAPRAEPTSGAIDDFAPRKPSRASKAPPRPSQKAVARVSSFPSREAPDDDQLNIKGPMAVLNRFRVLKKTERYKYSDLLDMMMDAYEAQQKKTRRK